MESKRNHPFDPEQLGTVEDRFSFTDSLGKKIFSIHLPDSYNPEEEKANIRRSEIGTFVREETRKAHEASDSAWISDMQIAIPAATKKMGREDAFGKQIIQEALLGVATDEWQRCESIKHRTDITDEAVKKLIP